MLKRAALFAVALALSHSATLRAETLKRDIEGFATGSTLVEAFVAGDKYGCALEFDPKPASWTPPQKNYDCEVQGKPSIRLMIGAYSHKVLEVSMQMEGAAPFEQFAEQACRQFKSDCESAQIDTDQSGDKWMWITLDAGLFLQVAAIGSIGPKPHYFVTLHNRSLVNAEETLPPPPLGFVPDWLLHRWPFAHLSGEP